MSDYRYTREASAEIEEHNGEITVRFCDASVAQWSHDLGPLSDWSDQDLMKEISELIEYEADDLARSLVKDLRERALAPTTPKETTL